MPPNFLFIIYLLSFSLIFTHSCNSQCLDHQQGLLLPLKNELIFDSSLSTKLVRWNQTSNDCCKWLGVECDGAGNVIGLQLDDESISGGFGDSSSMFGLKYLQKLNLSNNDFSSNSVPRGIQNLSSLITLSLDGCHLKGSFLDTIFHIKTLQNLDLSQNDELSGSIPPFTQNGSSLRSLVLRSTNFSGSIPSSISNLKTLSNLDLSSCWFKGSIPSTFANLTGLVHVDLSYNSFSGSLHSALFEGLSSLVFINLVHNSFSGSIPRSLLRLPSLQELWLGDNQFTGQLEELLHIVNASGITALDLSYNQLKGPIPDTLFQLHRLESLFLNENLLGSFQLDEIQRLPDLTQLVMSHNNLSVHAYNNGSLGHGLPHLQVLRLASCNLHSFPSLIIKQSYDMRVLDLSNNRIPGDISSWIWGTQLENLDLSFNLLTDLQKPYTIPPYLLFLDLHSNRLQGEVHHFVPPSTGSLTFSLLMALSLANNSLSGSIPASLCNATYLSILDLSVNKLSGNIPSCLFEGATTPSLLDLGRNNISGRIPDNFPVDCYLGYLDLKDNSLEGGVPKSLERCNSLVLMNVGNNIINDTFPCMLPSTLIVLVLRSNRFHGEVRCDRSWTDLQILDISSNSFGGRMTEWMPNHSKLYTSGVPLIMKGLEAEIFKISPEFISVDLSSNNFEGEIPNAMGGLSLLHLLNLSYNALNGSIPESFGKLAGLESLDLSQNRLSGQIPVELGGLTFLAFLNLSYNELVGEIPNGCQLQTFSADSFLGNPGLCGFNLNISCSGTDSPPLRNEEDEEKREVEYVIAALGYAVGLGSFGWLLLFCRSFREKYFGKIDEVVEDMFDARDRRRRRRSHARRVRRSQVRRQ